MRHWVVVSLAVMAAIPAFGDTRFRVRRMTRDDVPFGKGQCDIRLLVDSEVEVTVRGDMVTLHNLSGRESRDDGSECNVPVPAGNLFNFAFQVTEHRNEIRMLGGPTPRNGNSTVVRIHDYSGGYGRYSFRLTWLITMEAPGRGGPPPGRGEGRGPGDFGRGGEPGRGPDFWREAINFRGRGSGEAQINNFRPERLSDAVVDIDRLGRITVTFRSDRGRSLVFSGVLRDREGLRLRGEVESEDGRLRGPMFLFVDDRHNVNRISLEATDERDRLHLNWDRR
jgi:hypothetical protein